jgi:hypothetical protein
MSSNALNPDACWQWMVFISKTMPNRLIPIRKSFLESKEYERTVGEDFAVVARLSMEHAVLIRAAPGAYDTFEADFDVFNKALRKIANGDLTVVEALAWAQNEAESSIVTNP